MRSPVSGIPAPDSAVGLDCWRALLRPYVGPDDARSARQLAVTVVCYVLSVVLLVWTWRIEPWLLPVAAMPAAGFTVRLFIIAHDCGHGSYFASRRLADAVCFVVGVLTLTPHRYWRRSHATHHAHAGDLDRRGVGDVPVMTVAEYAESGPLRRAGYRLVRHPVFLIGAATFVHFLLVHRLPLGMSRDWHREWRSVWLTNAMLAALLAISWAWEVAWDYVLLHGAVMYWACAVAAWITHSQHQFEHTYWRRNGAWDWHEAALVGSTYLELPGWLRWLTADIGVHHVHHLEPRIPNYRLRACHAALRGRFRNVRRIGWRETLASFRYALWDEEAGRLVDWRTARGAVDHHAKGSRRQRWRAPRPSGTRGIVHRA